MTSLTKPRKSKTTARKSQPVKIPKPRQDAIDALEQARIALWMDGSLDAIRAATCADAISKALSRSNATALGHVYSAAKKALSSMGDASQAPRSMTDDAAAICATQPGYFFTSATELERAILKRCTDLVRAGVGRVVLAHRLNRMLTLSPLCGRNDVEAVKQALDRFARVDVDGRVLERANEDGKVIDLKEIITHAIRAVGITKKRRAKPFAVHRVKKNPNPDEE